MSASSLPLLPDQHLAAGVARLATRHAGRFSAETAQVLLTDSYSLLAPTAQCAPTWLCRPNASPRHIWTRSPTSGAPAAGCRVC